MASSSTCKRVTVKVVVALAILAALLLISFGSVCHSETPVSHEWCGERHGEVGDMMILGGVGLIVVLVIAVVIWCLACRSCDEA